jgi:hypothetical protein
MTKGVGKWLKITVGSVLKSPNGDLRPVRYLSAWPGTTKTKLSPLRGTHVAFSIRRCSWTGRCYTVYNLGELRGMGYTITGKTVRLDKPIDRKIAKDIGKLYPVLSCCAVKGLP